MATELLLPTGPATTPEGLVEEPTFFGGFVAHSGVVAAGILAVADVAARRWDAWEAGKSSRDPVVTASGDRLRFESLSVCNGVYARFDLLASGVDSGSIGFGTTNVDINPPLRAALSAMGRDELMRLEVGRPGLSVSTPEATRFEKKVAISDRWVRGLAEVPVASARMTRQGSISAQPARMFLSGLPMSAPGPTAALAVGPRGITQTSSSAPGAVLVAGTGRLGAAKRVARFVTGLTLYRDPAGGSACVVDLPGARLTLMLTPEPRRGFSGEGGLLEGLSGAEEERAGSPEDDAARLLEHLAWDPQIDPVWLGLVTGLSDERVAAGLAALASSGRVGFDLAEQAYFHRELPFDPDRVRRDNPRLVAARRLVAEGAVRAEDGAWLVRSSDGGVHRVTAARRSAGAGAQVGPVDGAGSCTCQWWLRYLGQRGPCKHLLAATIVAASAT